MSPPPLEAAELPTYHASYEIEVAGLLGSRLRAEYADLRIEENGGTTVLTGELDQSGLFGVLHRVRVHSLALIEVRRAS